MRFPSRGTFTVAAHAALQRFAFFGGQPAASGQVLINGQPPANPRAEQVLAPVAPLEVRLPGGGGYGRPENRDPDLRRRDFREGHLAA